MAQPLVGEIRVVAFNWAPVGWMVCDGTPLPISEYETLFTLIGTTYGGDGETTFNLPNLSSRLPMHRANNNEVGEMAGTEEVTLTVNQTPAHSHALLATTALASQGTPGNVLPSQSPTVQYYAEDAALTALAAQALGAKGGSQPHDNMHPYLVVNYIISLFGEYPSPT